MPRHWSVRVLRGLLALWFVLSVGEPSIVHFCPMHGGLLGELAGRAVHASMSGMDMPDMSGTSMPAAPTAHHHCTCISCCVGAGATALPGERVALGPATWTLAAAPLGASAQRLPRPGPAHAQPPGTGPPRA